MKDLVGQCFSLADGHYRIVDVRNLAGESMVYAEPVPGHDPAQIPAEGLGGHPGRGPSRAAFHYSDIAPFLAANRPA